MNSILFPFLRNLVASWRTTALGAMLGGPEILDGLDLLFDGDPATVGTGLLMNGIGMLFLGGIARDGMTSSQQVGIR